MNNIRCSQCGEAGLEQGFIEDTGQYSVGFVRWISGPIELTRLRGTAKTRGRSRCQIDAFRCPVCSHLELFAVYPG